MSGSGVRLIGRTMFSSAQLKNLGLKSLTKGDLLVDIVEHRALTVELPIAAYVLNIDFPIAI